jgi:hypothetical protein
MLPEIDLTFTENLYRIVLAIVLFGLGTALTLWSYYLRGDGSPVPYRGIMFLCRTVAIALISFLLFGPILRLYRVQAVKPSYSLLIDRSLSMTLAAGDSAGLSRIELAEDRLRRENILGSRSDGSGRRSQGIRGNYPWTGWRDCPDGWTDQFRRGYSFVL